MIGKKTLVACDIDGVIVPLNYSNSLMEITGTFHRVSSYSQQFFNVLNGVECTIAWCSYWEDDCSILNDFFNVSYDFIPFQVQGRAVNKEEALLHYLQDNSYENCIILDDEVQELSSLLRGDSEIYFLPVDGAMGVGQKEIEELEKILGVL